MLSGPSQDGTILQRTVVYPLGPPGAADGIFKLLLSASVIAFAISAALALFQRFYASSSMFHHNKAMKIAFRDDPTLNDAIEEALQTRSTNSLAHTYF